MHRSGPRHIELESLHTQSDELKLIWQVDLSFIKLHGPVEYNDHLNVSFWLTYALILEFFMFYDANIVPLIVKRCFEEKKNTEITGAFLFKI